MAMTEKERRLKNAQDKAKRDKERDKKASGKDKESWVSRLKKGVQKHFKAKKKKEVVSRRAEEGKQLRENLSPEDIKRLQGKKKSGGK